MREKRVFLKYGVQIPLVGRKICNILSIKNDFPAVRGLKSAQNTERCSFSAAAGAKKGEKFILPYRKIQFVQDYLVSKALGDVN